MFQGVFKSVHIETDEQLIHLSRYIHINPVATNVIRENDLFSYVWSSFPDYLNGESLLVSMGDVLGQFKNSQAYKEFVLNHINYAKELEKIKHLVLEN